MSICDPRAIMVSIRWFLFAIVEYINGELPDAESTTPKRGWGLPWFCTDLRQESKNVIIKCCFWHQNTSVCEWDLKACSHPFQSLLWAKTITLLMAISIGTSLPSSPILSTVLARFMAGASPRKKIQLIQGRLRRLRVVSEGQLLDCAKLSWCHHFKCM